MRHPGHPAPSATTIIDSVTPRTRKTLHLYNTPGGRTFCGRKFIKLSYTVCSVNAADFFTDSGHLRDKETLCAECEDTDEYRERHALYLLSRV